MAGRSPPAGWTWSLGTSSRSWGPGSSSLTRRRPLGGWFRPKRHKPRRRLKPKFVAGSRQITSRCDAERHKILLLTDQAGADAGFRAAADGEEGTRMAHHEDSQGVSLLSSRM